MSLIIKKINLIVIYLLIRGRKLNISLSYIAQSYFPVLKKHYTKFYTLFFIKISDEKELQQIAFNQSPDIDFKDFMNFYNVAKPYSIFSY